jgi:hypothetical protein
MGLPSSFNYLYQCYGLYLLPSHRRSDQRSGLSNKNRSTRYSRPLPYVPGTNAPSHIAEIMMSRSTAECWHSTCNAWCKTDDAGLEVLSVSDASEGKFNTVALPHSLDQMIRSAASLIFPKMEKMNTRRANYFSSAISWNKAISFGQTTDGTDRKSSPITASMNCHSALSMCRGKNGLNSAATTQKSALAPRSLQFWEVLRIVGWFCERWFSISRQMPSFRGHGSCIIIASHKQS